MKDYPVLKYKLRTENAYHPVRGTKGSSGLDVFSPIDIIVPARQDALIPTDLSFDIPFGWDLAVYNKSGIATKKKLFKGAELIDTDYVGNCHIHFFNHSDVDVEIKKGDKIGQLVMREVWMGELQQVDEIVKDTERGEGAFGSTDKQKEVEFKPVDDEDFGHAGCWKCGKSIEFTRDDIEQYSALIPYIICPECNAKIDVSNEYMEYLKSRDVVIEEQKKFLENHKKAQKEHEEKFKA